MPPKREAVTVGDMPKAAPAGTPYPKFLVKGDLERTVKNAAEEKAARADGWRHPHDNKGA